MKLSLIKFICRFLIASMLLMSFGAARAGMIGADQAATGNTDRAAVMGMIDRSDVATGLRDQGVDPQAAKDRVAAMTDEEASALRGQIEALPAGAASHSNGWWIAAVIIVAVVVWYFWR